MRLLCCVGSAALAAACVIPFFAFPASAANVTLTTAQTLALFGNTIEAEYLSTAGIYKPITLEYEGNHTIISENQSNSLGVSVQGREFIAYRWLTPSDLDVTPSTMRLSIETAVDLSSLTYIDTAFLQMTNLSLSTVLQSSYPNNYWYTSNGFYKSSWQPNDSDLFGYCVNSYNLNFTVIPVMFSAASSSDFSFGYISASSYNNFNVNNGYCYVGIVCPILSEDYIHSGNNGAGSGESSGGGSDSGSGSTDLSGVMTKLDSIIAKLDQIVANTSGGSSEDSSQNSSDQAAVNSMAADQSSKYDQANSYQDNVYEVADLDGVSLPDLENSYADIPADFSKFWYIDGQATFFVTMLLLTSGVAVVAFIIFGKTF